MNDTMDLTTSPFRRLRLLCGQTGSELMRLAADEHGKPLSRNALIYVEQGMYAAIPPRPVSALMTMCAHAGIDVAEVLEQEYGAADLQTANILWQKAVRASHADEIREAFLDWTTRGLSDSSPIYDFAEQFGTIDAFAKSMKVPTGPLSRYLDGELHMPVALITALTDAGLTQHDVTRLDEAHREWLDLRRVPAAV